MKLTGTLISLLGASCLTAFATATPASAGAKPCCYNNGQYYNATPSTCYRYGGRVIQQEYCQRYYGNNGYGYQGNYGNGYQGNYGYFEGNYGGYYDNNDRRRHRRHHRNDWGGEGDRGDGHRDRDYDHDGGDHHGDGGEGDHRW